LLAIPIATARQTALASARDPAPATLKMSVGKLPIEMASARAETTADNKATVRARTPANRLLVVNPHSANTDEPIRKNTDIAITPDKPRCPRFA
jgi:hypothetical protein